jgi:hypothetical protein
VDPLRVGECRVVKREGDLARIPDYEIKSDSVAFLSTSVGLTSRGPVRYGEGEGVGLGGEQRGIVQGTARTKARPVINICFIRQQPSALNP